MEEQTQRYYRQRSRLALAGLLIIAIGWMIGDAMVHGHTGLVAAVGGVATFAGVIGGPLLIIVGNIVLYRRHRDRNRHA